MDHLTSAHQRSTFPRPVGIVRTIIMLSLPARATFHHLALVLRILPLNPEHQLTRSCYQGGPKVRPQPTYPGFRRCQEAPQVQAWNRCSPRDQEVPEVSAAFPVGPLALLLSLLMLTLGLPSS
jgi:hypothetical protein